MPSRISFTFVATAALLAAAVASPLARRQNDVYGRRPSAVKLSNENNRKLDTIACTDVNLGQPELLNIEKHVFLPQSILGSNEWNPAPRCGGYIKIYVGGDKVIDNVRIIGASWNDENENMVASQRVWDELVEGGQNQQGDTDWIRWIAGWEVVQGEAQDNNNNNTDQGDQDDDDDDAGASGASGASGAAGSI